MSQWLKWSWLDCLKPDKGKHGITAVFNLSFSFPFCWTVKSATPTQIVVKTTDCCWITCNMSLLDTCSRKEWAGTFCFVYFFPNAIWTFPLTWTDLRKTVNIGDWSTFASDNTQRWITKERSGREVETQAKRRVEEKGKSECNLGQLHKKHRYA